MEVAKIPQVDGTGHAQQPLKRSFRVSMSSFSDYDSERLALLQGEHALAFDSAAAARASDVERDATALVAEIRERERREAGVTRSDHFLGNVERIKKSQLMAIARRMPKGAHLHCHLNSCLDPIFLIRRARHLRTMFIRSSTRLVDPTDFNRAAITFSVLPENSGGADLFHPEYEPLSWMPYTKFLEKFPPLSDARDPEDWLVRKLIITEHDAHDVHQTSDGIWDRFNQCTQMLKGLFNYESAFRGYIGEVIQSFVDDNTLYAEVRPNFFDRFIMSDDGQTKLDHREWMKIIREEVEKKRKALAAVGVNFYGVKVIYCAPRSIRREDMTWCLQDCMQLKREFPELICGFDMVGCEDRGNPIRHYIKELLAFRRECAEEGLYIPFIFHAGETLKSGESTDANILDAIVLGTKRIGHGYALARHPELLKVCRERGIAIETCPISNEILHLCPSISAHILPTLLANGIPCTLNSDNPTFFRSSLAHDFYQVMSGFDFMTLHGWRVLAEWSIEHSCMPPLEKTSALQDWERRWLLFCRWIVDEYGPSAGARCEC